MISHGTPWLLLTRLVGLVPTSMVDTYVQVHALQECVHLRSFNCLPQLFHALKEWSLGRFVSSDTVVSTCEYF